MSKIYACYIFRLDGISMFDEKFYPMPETALVTGMVSAMQSFIKEISGSYANKLSAGDFVFHIERIGKFSIALVTSDEETPKNELTKIRTTFINKYGRYVDDFMGQTDHFEPFADDLRNILNIQEQRERINPTKQMTSFALLSIEPALQKVAKEIIMAKKATAVELMGKLDETEFVTEEKLEKLLELGYVGRYFEKDVGIYFIE